MRRTWLLMAVVLMVSGCTLRSVRTPPLPAPEQGLLPLGNCAVTAEYVVTKSSADLIAQSTWIVEAEVGKRAGTRNLARRVNGADPGLTVEGVDYPVTVKRYLKGQGPERLTISLVRSEMQGGQKLACAYPDYAEPKAGSRWVLFLKPSPDFADLAVGAGYPWRYPVVDGKLTTSLPGDGPLLTVDELAARIAR